MWRYFLKSWWNRGDFNDGWVCGFFLSSFAAVSWGKIYCRWSAYFCREQISYLMGSSPNRERRGLRFQENQVLAEPWKGVAIQLGPQTEKWPRTEPKIGTIQAYSFKKRIKHQTTERALKSQKIKYHWTNWKRLDFRASHWSTENPTPCKIKSPKISKYVAMVSLRNV